MTASRLLMPLGALLLGACGFALRQELALPAGLERIRLEVADPASPLGRDLGAALARAGAEIVPADAGDAALLRVPVNAIATEPLTVGGNARVQEYVVRYAVEIELLDASGAVRLARTPIRLERDYSFDETQALGAAAEEALLRQELQREMVQQVLRRIATLR